MNEPQRIPRNPTPLDQLLFQWHEWKQAERKANAARVEVEEQIAALVNVPEEGSAKTETDYYKMTVTGTMRRTVDEAALSALRDQIPDAIRNRVFRYKPSLDLKELRYVQNNEPDIYTTLAQVITAKPGNPTFKVEEK